MPALIDGNNFYVSYERVFQPWLQCRPVVVLSNNDGCAIARSDEAKTVGIKMGAPYFQVRELARDAGLIALSANFALYGDMSDRMCLEPFAMKTMALWLAQVDLTYQCMQELLDGHGH
jgi:DNA polymerase V